MIQVFLLKRPLRKRKRNGAREYRWILRWEDSTGWRQASTGTADRTQAEALQKAKWAALNAPPEQRPKPEPVKPTWQECRAALDRAMRADNLRPSYVANSLLTFDQFQRMFPRVKSPADVTPEMANEYKRQRAEAKKSPWSIKGDLATLKAAFGKWLGRECGLLQSNPFAGVRPPKCDDPEIRIVAASESEALFAWLADRWNNWKLPAVYLEVAALLGWRATEIASIRTDDLLSDGFVKVAAETCKTRRHKYGWLPAELYADVQACSANGWAFGRFSDELTRLLFLWKRRPNHAARVKDFTPKRLVSWLQDELQRFNEERAKEATKARKPEPPPFTLHDFRRTAITGLQMAGVSEKETSIMVGATPEVIRRHYEKMDAMVIAKRSIERRLGHPTARFTAHRLREGRNQALDAASDLPETATA